jgi:hypothetical protein
VEIHPSARRHGITDDDMLHAIEHSLVVLMTVEGDELIIHAMSLRPVYRRLLDP